MAVKRIVANVAVDSTQKVASFYKDILGLELLMDLGWIRTYGANREMPVQISIAEEGGSGTPVPNLSIEVDDLDDILAKVRSHDIDIEYGPVDEPWGVTRIFIRDPCGNLINILQHT